MKRIKEFIDNAFTYIVESKFCFLFFLGFLLLIGFGLVYLRFLLTT